MRLRYFWRLLVAASKLDIFDLAYEFSSEGLNSLSLGGHWEKTNGFPRKGLVIRFGIFFWHFYKSLVAYWRRRGATILPESFMFFAISKNEIDCLRPVFARISNAYLTDSIETPFPFFWAYALSCAYLPLVVINFLRATGYRRKSFAYVFDHYWLIYGLYVAGRMWLRKIEPKALILANQVYPHHRVMLKAASDESVPTVYLQHASITEGAPPLIHDYALLEGKDALSKLARGGPRRTRIFLIGMPKHDAYFRLINTNAEVHSIGICTNHPDSLLRAEDLLMQVRREFPAVKLTLRPHNADLRFAEWREMATRCEVDFSDSNSELSFDFLSKVDALVAGDSNILLEAAMMNVYPLYYDYNRTQLDWYGFRRNNLVEYFSEPDQVCHCIAEISKSKPSVRMKANRYCATVGTRYDGRSSELASALIQAVGSASRVNFEEWKRSLEIDMEVYELNCDQDAA